jgi:aminopeptidase
MAIKSDLTVAAAGLLAVSPPPVRAPERAKSLTTSPAVTSIGAALRGETNPPTRCAAGRTRLFNEPIRSQCSSDRIACTTPETGFLVEIHSPISRRTNPFPRCAPARLQGTRLPPPAASIESPPMRDPRLEKLAGVLVSYSTAVKPGQLVRISGPPVSQPLIVELYRKVIAAGGHPAVRMVPEELNEIFLKNASDEQLRFLNPIGVFEYEKIDVSIGIWAEENTKALTNCDPKKIGITQAARKPLMDLFMKRAAEGSLKWTGTQFPSQAPAQDAEMSLAEYEDFVFNAGLLHEADPIAAWKRLSERQKRLVDHLNGKKEYRVVATNGTDVRMSVEGRTWINCDGHENLPDGEVFTGPVIDSVEGQINFSFPAVHHGREVRDVKLTFKGGKVVDASAGKGEDFLISMLDMDGGSRMLGECAIGTNYSIQQYTRNTLFDEKIGGTVHFALGAGYPETGNTNQSGLHWDMVVDLRKGGHIEIDGEEINVNGRFTRDGFPSA